MTPHAFPKEARLLKRSEFLRVQNTGRRIHGTNFMLFIRAARNPDSRPRLGITVTTKIHKRSHVRNRIKRLLRETFRQHQHDVRRGVEVVVSARTDCVTLSGAHIQEELIGTFRHAGLMQKRGDEPPFRDRRWDYPGREHPRRSSHPPRGNRGRHHP